jgi:hypothetical protein
VLARVLAAGTSLAADERPWTEIPAVRIVGLLLGAAFLWIAIRSMFGRGGRR